MSLKKVAACIKRNNRFLITTHTNSEGDALGSQLAFYKLLKIMGKQAIIVNEDKVPYGYGFLPGINNIQRLKQNLKNLRFDCFVVLDCSDLSRCGKVAKLSSKDVTVLNIDHHISNTKFGDINWVDSRVSSTCEVIYKLYKRLSVPFNKEIATYLYIGMLTDTGSFRYSNTTSFTHKAVSALLRYGLDVVKIYNNLYENIPFEDMKLLSKILLTLRRDAQGKIAWFKVGRNTLKNKKISVDISEYILSFGRAIKDVEVVVLFKENLGTKNEVRVNFRSNGRVDVNRIANFFGGGGHRTASGATVRGRIDQVQKKVLAKIKESLK